MQPLTGTPREAFTPAQVLAALSPNRAMMVRHGVTVLDYDDMETGETLNFESAAVTWSFRPPDPVVDGRVAATNAVSEVRRRGEINLVGSTSIPLAQRRYRLWTEFLSPEGEWVRFNLGVFVATIPSQAYDGSALRTPLSLWEKTHRMSNRPLDDTVVVLAGDNPVDWVRTDLGTRFGETSFAITSSPVVLDDDKVFEPSMSWLQVYNALLETAAFDQLTNNEQGQPSSRPLSTIANTGAEISYGPGDAKIIPSGEVTPLLSVLPNTLRFIARNGPTIPDEGDGIRTITNPSTGPASLAELGEAVVQIIEVDAEDQVQLDEIALADAQRYFAGGGLRFDGQVALNPRHSDRDVVSLNHPALGLSGTWHVTSWTYPMSKIESPQDVLMPITMEQRVEVEVAA